MRKPFVAGNWKMNMDLASSLALARELKGRVGERADVTLAVCPPFCYLKAVADVLAGSAVAVGGQNMYPEPKGAFTGELSAEMLLDVGCTYVILGHSERRHVMGEGDELINAKVLRALQAGLKPILCVGETIEQRKADRTGEVVTGQVRAALGGVSADQMARITIAYEPVWAIGTGLNATPQQAQEVHAMIRSLLADIHGRAVADLLVIQYGGSVKPDNAADLMTMPDVDGALVGGASLKANAFVPIIDACPGAA